MNKVKKNIKEFQPTRLGVFYHPAYFIRRNLFLAIRDKVSLLYGVLLDFGCGSKPYKNLIDVETYVGVDIEVSGHNHEHSDIDVYYDGTTLPFTDNYFDCFLSSEVFEHLPNPQQMANELFRVLKPNGIGVVTVPFVWPMHEVPYDFNRFTIFGISQLFEEIGFEIVEAKKLGTYGEVIIQLISQNSYARLSRLHKVVRLVIAAITVLPVNVVGFFLTRIWAKNQDLYFNTILIVRKK